MSKFFRFGIFDEDWFLVFGVPNAEYLAFGTPDGSGLNGFKWRLELKGVQGPSWSLFKSWA